VTPENTQKLLKRFPILYQDYYGSMKETCMVWGFEVSDGWLEIIYQLSLAIEDELGYTRFQKFMFMCKKRWARRWNALIYRLSPVGTSDIFAKFFQAIAPKNVRDGTKDCYPDAYQHRWYLLGSYWAHLELGLKALTWHPNTGFAVSQVKEKYGTLRFYCGSNDRIDHLVDLAERASELTCEICGKYGKMRNKGWMMVRCDTCWKEQQRKRRESEKQWKNINACLRDLLVEAERVAKEYEKPRPLPPGLFRRILKKLLG